MRPFTLFFLSLLLGLFTGCSTESSSPNIKVSEAPAGGLRDSDFDSVYLQRLAEETRQGAEASLQHAYERNHIPEHERVSHAKTEARYQQLGGRRLAVIELSYSANPMHVTRIVGLVKERLITLSCISPQGARPDIQAAGGECADAVRRHFAITDN